MPTAAYQRFRDADMARKFARDYVARKPGETLVVKADKGTPVLIRDVARVELGPDERRGLERGADALARPLDLERAGDDPADLADLLPAGGERIVAPGPAASTKIPVGAAVIDLFSRRVVGWSMKAEMTSQLVTDALMMAIWRRGKPDALLHHSDRGSQYGSEAFQRLLVDHGIVCSMSRAGNVWDNAAMESFFSSLKTERTARKLYRTRDQARADVFDYIERFYNPKRRHSTIGYMSPMEFERQAGLA